MVDIVYESFVDSIACELFGLSKKEKEAKAAKIAEEKKRQEEFDRKYELAEKFMKDKTKMNPIIKKLLTKAISRFYTVAEDIFGGKTPAGKAPKAKDFDPPKMEVLEYGEDPCIRIHFDLNHEYCDFLYKENPDKISSASRIEEYAWIFFDYNPFTNQIENICQYDS